MGLAGERASEALASLFDMGSVLQRDYAAAADRLRRARRVLIAAHEGPDGDAIGSTLAMWWLAQALGKDAVAFNSDPVPHNLDFLPGADRIVHALPDDAEFDLTVMLDCAHRARLGARFPAQGWGREILVIDHHETWDASFADAYIRDTTAAAVGEMIYRLALSCGVGVDLDLAKCCYASIVSDTGSFRYGNTTPTTFAIVSRLLQCGVQPWEMSSNLFENDPLERIVLLRRVLETLTVSPCKRLAFIRIDRRMVEETATTPDMLDGFINYARRVRGVEVATQLREMAPDEYKVSFRSRGAVNVAELAARFGGGGHHNAAACRMVGDIGDIQRRLAQQLNDLLSPPAPTPPLEVARPNAELRSEV